MHSLDKTMKENKIVLPRLAGVVIQRTRDAKRARYASEFKDAKAKGLTASFFKDFLIVGMDGIPHVAVTDILRGREIVCPSIGAAMGFIQAKLFHQGYLV